MIHTIIPIEILLKNKEQDKISPYQELTINGVSCYVEKLNDFEYRIIRIHTSDPNNYIDSSLQPGSIVNLKDRL